MAEVTGFIDRIAIGLSKFEGSMRKLMNVSRLAIMDWWKLMLGSDKSGRSSVNEATYASAQTDRVSMIDLDELIDIAPTGIATQSSLSKWSLPAGAQALVQPHQQEFSIHTNTENSPWWQIDLCRIYPLNRIVIENRANSRFLEPARHLVVECSTDGVEWTLLHSGLSYFGGGDIGPPMQLELLDEVYARFVRLSLPDREALHLRRVNVFVQRRAIIMADFIDMHCGVRNLREAARIVATGSDVVPLVIGLKIKRGGRLANNMLQVIRALHVARALGLRYVLAPDISLGIEFQEVTVDGITLLPASANPPSGLWLEAKYFHDYPIHVNNLKRPNQVQHFELAQRYLIPFFNLDVNVTEIESRKRDVAIHIRSGDIFGSKPHRDYAQPPFAFYKAVVDDMLGRNMVDRVVVVAEDRQNPCIDRLCEYLAQNSVPHRLQSGTLLEDIRCIMTSGHRVFGYGTFGYGLCLISHQFDSVHVFGMKLYDGLPNVHELVSIHPTPKTYIGKGEWENTQEQRKLMLEYPESLLTRGM